MTEQEPHGAFHELAKPAVSQKIKRNIALYVFLEDNISLLDLL